MRGIANTIQSSLKWFDPFVAMLFAVVVLATILPCQGRVADLLSFATNIGVVVLFFMHGAKLSREAVKSGFLHWRLHLTTLLVTFLVFPVLGVLIVKLPILDSTLVAGMLFLAVLPSTVQSSIAFTSIAGGNVPGAVCAATLSNLVGMFLTPAMVALLMNAPGVDLQLSWTSVSKIVMQLLLPFVVGHLSRPWISEWVTKRKSMLGRLDRGTILLIVYTAFSASVVDGLWDRVSMQSLAFLILVCAGLLLAVGLICWGVARWMQFERADSIVLFFCGSKKSLASGVPIAGTLFPEAQIGLIILPIMVFHQIQLVACAIIARRLGEAVETKPAER